MLYLQELQSTIPTITVHLAEDREKIRHIIVAAHHATDISDQKRNDILKAATDALAFISYLNANINDIFLNITNAWREYKEKNPIIMPRYFILDENGNVQETDAKTFSKLPKPIDDYHVDTREYENIEDIPGSSMRRMQKN